LGKFLQDDLHKVTVPVHVSEGGRAIELEDVRHDFVDEAEVVDVLFLPVAGAGLVVGEAGCYFEEEGDVLLVLDEEAEEGG
jgi:hypothetical protein